MIDVQRTADYDVWETSLHNPNFAEYAALCGLRSARVTDGAELEGALRDAIAHSGPACVEVMANPDPRLQQAQHALLAVATTQEPPYDAADNVEEADQCQRRGPHLGCDLCILQ